MSLPAPAAKPTFENRYQALMSSLDGPWSQDTWNIDTLNLQNANKPGIVYRFTANSVSINHELKFALKHLLTSQQWKANDTVQGCLHTVIKFLNTHQNVHTLRHYSLHDWKMRLRTYLLEIGRFQRQTKTNIKKDGTRQNYPLMPREIYYFARLYQTVADYYDTRVEWDKDIIDLRRVGLSLSPGTSSPILNLSRLRPDWLREATRQMLRYHANTKSCNTLKKYLHSIQCFSRFLAGHHGSSTIDRQLILELIAYLHRQPFSAGYIKVILGSLKVFLEYCAIYGITEVPNKPLIFREDFPKPTLAKPKFLPDAVHQQILAHIDQLSEPYRTMLAILDETGCRVGELFSLTIDCLHADSVGDYFLKRWIAKQQKYHTVPITHELATLIRAAIKTTQAQWGSDAHYLFPNPKNRPRTRDTFDTVFNQWAVQCNIRDQGRIPHFHQFRHTVGTRMINNGISQYIVKQFLGHDSPDMTAVYAHLHDDTKKQALAQFLAQSDSQISSPKFLDHTGHTATLDQVWLKKNLLAQALPNGICALPVQIADCPHANACLDCQQFRTSRAFLPVHRQQLADSEQAEATAREAGKHRQAKKASETSAKLRTLINQLEEHE